MNITEGLKPDGAWYSDAEMRALYPISDTTIFRLRKAGKFPRAEQVTEGRKLTRARKFHAFLADPVNYREGEAPTTGRAA